MTGLKIKLTPKWSFYALFSLLMLLLFFRYSLLIYFPSIVFVAIFAMISMFGDRSIIFAVCLCCIPLYMSIQHYYVIAFCIIIYLIKYGRDIKLDLSFVPILLIVIWEILHCFLDSTNLKSMIAMVALYVFFILLISLHKIYLNYGFIVRVFSVMVLWTIVLLIARLLIEANYNLNEAFINIYRLGYTEDDSINLITNPNSLGIQCVLAVSCLVQLRMCGQKKATDLLLIISLLVLGALTVSRTYLACLLIMVLYLFLVSKGGIKKKFSLLVGIVIVFFFGILVLNFLFPMVLKSFATRLDTRDITGGRANLLRVYNEYLISSAKSLFWGIGSNDMGTRVVTECNIFDGVPHNGIQELLVAWGIPGLLFFACFIFVLIRRAKQENPNLTLMNYLPLVILLAKTQVGQLITSPYTMLSFVIIYLGLCFDINKKNQVKN